MNAVLYYKLYIRLIFNINNHKCFLSTNRLLHNFKGLNNHTTLENVLFFQLCYSRNM